MKSFSTVPALGVAAMLVVFPVCAGAQTPPRSSVTIAEAVALAVANNPALRAERAQVDAARADEITAALKPNPIVSTSIGGLTPFSPGTMTGRFFADDLTINAGIDYLIERGDKRRLRVGAAADARAQVAAQVADAERQLRYQTAQSAIDVLLAQAQLAFAQTTLDDMTQAVTTHEARVRAGDLSTGDFLKISLQKLQCEQDVSAARLALAQAQAALRQWTGGAVAADVTVVSALDAAPFTLPADLLPLADDRADLVAAVAAVRSAEAQLALQRANAAVDLTAHADYTHASSAFQPFDHTLALSLSVPIAVHDRNQGNVARAEATLAGAQQSEAAARLAVATDIAVAVAAFHDATRS